MSQRPQRAAAVQAIKANTATLAPRRRSDSQASIKTITSQSHFKTEDRRYDGQSSPSMDIAMQRSSHQDLRRLDMMGDGGGNSSNMPASHDDLNGSSYSSNVFPVYWPTQDDPSVMGAPAPHASPASAYHPPQLWPGTPTHSDPHALQHYDAAPNHGMFDLHYGYATQANSLGLKGEPGLNVGLEGTLDLSQRVQREQRSFDNASSDALALLDDLPFKASSSADNDSYEDSTDSDLPPEKKKLSAAFRPRGRKKRNKCTPDQLRSLEAFFEKNRNPTGRIRLELSRKLRMPERSVQVWFQNRRAKVKTVERRGDTGSDSGKKRSCSIRLSDKDTHSKSTGTNGRAMRDDPADDTPSVTAIPTSALCIGTWRRVSPLICFFSRRLQSLTWYLTSESIGFKLEIPWTSIRSAYFDGPSNPSIAERAEGVRVPLGHFVIDLERPPTFFMEVFRSAPAKYGDSGGPRASWRQCEDFTEDRQAMTISRHVINGPYEELRIAVQAFANCNDVLRRLVKFHDEEQRAAGAIPTGSGSTADNFGLIGNGVGIRPADPYAHSMGAPPPLPPPMDVCAAPMSGVDAFGSGMHMPMQSSVPMSTSSSASSMHRTAPSAWNHFRTPTRPGVENGWEFDSPASVSTNLSEASVDSHQRHPVGFSPYGMTTSIEASPRSGLGSSMDLNTLRIDTGGGMSNFGAAPHHMSVVGHGGTLDSSRGSAAFHAWDTRLGYDLSSSQHAEEPYSLASSGVLEGNAHHLSDASTMQPPGTAMDTTSMGSLAFQRGCIERQDYSSNHVNAGQGSSLQQVAESSTADPSHHPQESHRSGYDGNKGFSDEYHANSNPGSLLQSRRLSHPEAGAGHDASEHSIGQAQEADAMSRRSDQDPNSAFTACSAPTLMVPSGSSGSSNGNGSEGNKMTSLEEDAFCGKTPTYRTSFGTSLQMSQANHSQEQQQGVSDRVGGYESDDDGDGDGDDDDDDDEEHAGQGRARSNTYRPSTHGGAGRTETGQRSSPSQHGGSGHISMNCAELQRTNHHHHEAAVAGNGEYEGGGHGCTVNTAAGAIEMQVESPGLLSLSSSSMSSSTTHHLAKRDPSPMSSSTSSLSSTRSSADQHGATADEQ